MEDPQTGVQNETDPSVVVGAVAVARTYSDLGAASYAAVVVAGANTGCSQQVLEGYYEVAVVEDCLGCHP